MTTPYMAGCATSLNPDAQDMYLEQVENDKYLASDGTWKDVKVISEVIKVRFGRDVHFDIKATDNGVLLPKDLQNKETASFSQHLTPEMWLSDEELWKDGKAYSLAVTIDPLTHHNLGPGDPYKNYVSQGGMLKLYATDNEFNKDPETFIRKIRVVGNVPVNNIYIFQNTNDIFYFQGGGVLPRRENNVAQGVYPKKGWLPQNKWNGRIPHEEMPFMVNPKSGYIVSTNNFMTSTNVKHGIS
jgi:penicillin G amidase